MRKNSFSIFVKLFVGIIILSFNSCAVKKLKSPTEKVIPLNETTVSRQQFNEVTAEMEKQIHNQQQIIEMLSERLRSVGLMTADGVLKTPAERVVEKPVTGNEPWLK